MKVFKLAVFVCFLALTGPILAPTAKADTWTRKTVVTFSAPVEIPGVHLRGWGVLPAGTYVFKIVDSQSDRHIVQIFSQDEKTVYATVLAIPNYRLKATGKTVITFSERPAGEPEALRAWFYPGMNWGEEFVYPKEKALTLAKSSNKPILSTQLKIATETAEPIKALDEPVILELKRAPLVAIKPTGEEIELALVVSPRLPTRCWLPPGCRTPPAPCLSLHYWASLPSQALWFLACWAGALRPVRPLPKFLASFCAPHSRFASPRLA